VLIVSSVPSLVAVIHWFDKTAQGNVRGTLRLTFCPAALSYCSDEHNIQRAGRRNDE
jgi:hypothetical protein